MWMARAIERLPPSKGIKSRTHHNILPESTENRFGQPFLGKSASQRKQRTKQYREGRALLIDSGQDSSCRGFRYEPDRHRVLEDGRPVE